MKIYRLKFSSSEPGKFAWCTGYGPLDEDMKFLHPVVRDRIQKTLWEVNKTQPGLTIDSGGRYWPDVLGCGQPPPLYFLSERVILSLRENNIPFERLTRMPIAKIDSITLKEAEAPNYFVVEVGSGIAVSWKEMGIPADVNGRPVLRPYPKPWPPRSWKFNLNSWTGHDLFTWSNFKDGDRTDLLCTERLKEIAVQHSWTNVAFELLAEI